MANVEQLAILKSGAEAWNLWRRDHLEAPVDLAGARLEEANLDRANLTGANLKDAKLVETRLSKANLDGADLTGAWLMGAYLNRATLRGAVCGGANLNGANLNKADLSGATFVGADLSFVRLVGTRLHGATFDGCRIYGISAWDLDLDEHTQQSDLIITPDTQPAITVDSLKVAQFLYLIINNKELRDVIDTITSKVVLILGRFTPERKAVLDSLRAALAEQKDAQGNRRYITVMFDFAKPDSQDYLQPVTTIAHMARFVVADFTDSKVVNAEVSAIAGAVTLPILPLLQAGSPPEYLPGGWAAQFRGVLATYRYQDTESLIAGLAEHVIGPVEAKRAELQSLLHALP